MSSLRSTTVCLLVWPHKHLLLSAHDCRRIAICASLGSIALFHSHHLALKSSFIISYSPQELSGRMPNTDGSGSGRTLDVVVFGATGFTGSRVFKKLAEIAPHGLR